MKYVVHAVPDQQLPAGVDHLIVERDNGEPPVLIVAGAPSRVWTFMRAFEDSREPCHAPSVLLRAV